MAGPYSSSAAVNYWGAGKETTKGTGVAPTVFVPYQGDVDLDHAMGEKTIHEAGVGPYASRNMKQKHDPGGKVGAAWRPSTFGKLAAWFLGADTISGAGPYTHTCTPAESLTHLTVEQNLNDEAIERFVDCYLKGLSVEGKGGDDLMATVDWFGFTPDWRAAATTDTYETGISGVTPGGPFRMNEGVYTVDGSAATNVQEWKIDWSWKFDEDIRLSAVTRAYTQKLELTGKITLKQLMIADVNDYRKVNFYSTSGTAANKNFFPTGAFIAAFDNGLTTTNNRQITFTCPQIAWTKAKYTSLNPDGQTVYLEREGIIEKPAAAAFSTIVGITGDSTGYLV